MLCSLLWWIYLCDIFLLQSLLIDIPETSLVTDDLYLHLWYMDIQIIRHINKYNNIIVDVDIVILCGVITSYVGSLSVVWI